MINFKLKLFPQH